MHVQRERCSTCIYRPGNLMQLRPGRVASMQREADGAGLDGGSIICHQTLGGAEAVCRGYFDHGHSLPLRVAVAFGVVEWVDCA